MASANSNQARLQNANDESAGATTLSRRKADGVFYTPDSIVRYIVEQTLSPALAERPDDLPPLRVLDPACGDGAFLVEVFRFLSSRVKSVFQPMTAPRRFP